MTDKEYRKIIADARRSVSRNMAFDKVSISTLRLMVATSSVYLF